MTRDTALEELRRALALVQPDAPNKRDRTGCLCVLSPRVVAWLVEELEQAA